MTSLAHVPHSTPVRSGGDSDIPYRGFRRTPFTDDHLTSLSRRNCRGGFGRPGFPLTHGLEQASHGCSRSLANVNSSVKSLRIIVGHYSHASLAGDNLQDEAANVCAVETKVPHLPPGEGRV